MRKILEKLAKGEISVDEAETMLKLSAIEEISNIAKVDISRELRRGIPEIILATGKLPEETARIALHLTNKKGRAIISRADDDSIKAINKIITSDIDLTVYQRSKMIVMRKKGIKLERSGGKIGIITAGTSDINVAEEAKVIAEEIGCEVFTAYDVGVAGIHRLFGPLKEMLKKEVDALVVVAGMEGALPSLVSSLVDIPVIGVPTSLSFGYGEKGVSALMAMLQSCSLGLSVVNIDNGVGAGAFAALIAKRVANKKRSLLI